MATKQTYYVGRKVRPDNKTKFIFCTQMKERIPENPLTLMEIEAFSPHLAIKEYILEEAKIKQENLK